MGGGPQANVFKNLEVGECVIIGKYPQAWNKKVRIPPPEQIAIDQGVVLEKLRELRLLSQNGKASQPLGLKQLVKAQYVKLPPKPKEEIAAPTAPSENKEPPSDPNV